MAVTPKERKQGQEMARADRVEPDPVGDRERLRQAHGCGRVPLADAGRQGRDQLKTTARNGNVVGILLVNEKSELMVISQFGKIIRIDSDNIREAGRSTQGVSCCNWRMATAWLRRPSFLRKRRLKTATGRRVR